MFDLETMKGWIELAAAAVGVITACVVLYLKVFPRKNVAVEGAGSSSTEVDVSGQVNQTGTGNVVGSSGAVTVQNITGYTIEQHEERLEKREAELRAEFEQSNDQADKKHEILERELEAIRGQLVDIEKSFEERQGELERTAKGLESFGKVVPTDQIEQAIKALNKGSTEIADTILVDVEASAESTIEIAARAAYERGCIAFDEVRWIDARDHFQRADRLQPGHEDYAWKAAMLAAFLGDYRDAESRYEAILADIEDVEGTPHAFASMAMNNLALVYKDQGRYDEAEALCQKAIAIDETALPAGHLSLATRYNNLAGIYKDQGRYDEAEALYQNAIAIDEAALSAGNPELATDYNNLAGVYKEQGRYGEAAVLFQKAIAIDEAALPAGHPTLATKYNNLASVYKGQGRLDDAEVLYQKATAIDEAALPAGHPSLGRDYNNLALVYDNQGRFNEAEGLYQKALQIQVSTFGIQHPNSKLFAKNYAILLDKEDRSEEAFSVREEYGL